MISSLHLEFAKSQRAVENREKLEENGCEVIYGASTTLAVKGQVKEKNAQFPTQKTHKE